MRGSIIEYQQTDAKLPKYLSYFKDIVWGIASDTDSQDYLEIGKFGCHGFIPVEDAIGIDITNTILVEYGFLRISATESCTTYYRDDFGHIKLDTYGVEHVYMKGKCIKYLHNFQRIFLDYTGKLLYPKPSELPRVEWKSKYVETKVHTADEMLEKINELKNISSGGDISMIDFELKL